MIFDINITCGISKLLFVISRAVKRVKFETILKYHEWYLCQISCPNHAVTVVSDLREVISKQTPHLYKHLIRDAKYGKMLFFERRILLATWLVKKRKLHQLIHTCAIVNETL